MLESRKTAHSILGMIAGLVLIIVSLTISVPSAQIGSRHLSRRAGGYVQYVGGDAYNIMIEASLRGGEIAGRTTARAVYLTGGIMLFSISLIAFGFASPEKKKKAPQPAVPWPPPMPAYHNNPPHPAPTPVHNDDDPPPPTPE